ncbi:MAG: trypsin-like peptidase domain-containing protein, partial [Pirellulales bacterium]|nr:trypsin-like peptidase domain-containing protein [Pirellulales bacterium]
PAFVFIGGGSGVIVRPDGLMLTNDHVIGRKRTFTVRIGDGRSFKAKVLGTDPVGDLAALQLDVPAGETVPHLELGDSNALCVGDEALAVGNPFALGVLDQAPTFTVGIISALNHTQGTYAECIVTDAEVNPGNSGGPLVNMAGEVVGINGQISTRFGLRSNTGLGFAISSRQLKLWLPRLEAAGGGEVKHARIAGLELAEAARESSDSVVVRDVADGSPADTAGFKTGDRIISLDGADVANALRLRGLLGIYPDGHSVPVMVDRDGSESVLEVTLTAPERAKLGLDLVRARRDDLVARVEEVEEGSAAALAGFQPGDEIVAWDGRRLEFGSRDERRAFDRALRTSVNVGDIVPVTIRRDDGQGGSAEVMLRLVAR